MSYHDWIPLVVRPVPLEPLPIVALVGDETVVRVEHREGWVREAVVYHFGFEARRVVFPP